MDKKSLTACPLSIVDAVRLVDKVLGDNRQWRTVNDAQRLFLERYFERFRAITATISDISSIASSEAEEINKFLADRGFTIQLRKFSQYEFGIASILDLLVEWSIAGKQVPIRTSDRREFPGVELSKHCCSFGRAQGHSNVIARLETKSTDMVYLTMMDQPESGADLIEIGNDLIKRMRWTSEFEGMIFPMVNLRQTVDISWLLEMETDAQDGVPWYVSQAAQENRLRMNEIGAHAQSATAIAVKMRGIEVPKPKLVIDKPFLVVFVRPGIDIPLFAAYVTEADWQNPGSLTD